MSDALWCILLYNSTYSKGIGGSGIIIPLKIPASHFSFLRFHSSAISTDSISSSRPEIISIEPLRHFSQLKAGPVIVHSVSHSRHLATTGISSIRSSAPARGVSLVMISKQKRRLDGTTAESADFEIDAFHPCMFHAIGYRGSCNFNYLHGYSHFVHYVSLFPKSNTTDFQI